MVDDKIEHHWILLLYDIEVGRDEEKDFLHAKNCSVYIS